MKTDDYDWDSSRADRIAPDVVVMGTISRGDISGLLVGNIAERLLGILDKSLVVVKPDGFVCLVELDSRSRLGRLDRAPRPG